MGRRLAFALLAVFVFAELAAAAPQSPEERSKARAEAIRSHYGKFEYRIPMRDGARLHTSVYVPTDASEEKRYPILMWRTPYAASPYSADRYRKALATEELEEEGFIFVIQDVRGRFLSDGDFVNMRPHSDDKSKGATDESSDTYDTVEWLLKNLPYQNGKVGLWGISYPGFYASSGAIDSHPAIVAVSPQAPIADWFWDDMHRHGAFNLALTFMFFARFGVPRTGLTTEWPDEFDPKTPDGYQFFMDMGSLRNAQEKYFHEKIPFWNEVAKHPNYDAYWKARNLAPHLRNVKCAVLTVGGWFDTEDLFGALHTYSAIENQNPGIKNQLVMGPWPHGEWIRGQGDKLGSADFGYPTGEWFRKNVFLPFMKEHLKGEGKADLPEALIFETGSNRWRRFATWPPADAAPRSLFLREQGGLAWDAPRNTKDESDDYVSDPAKPVPYTADIVARWSRDYMTEDQRFAARRPDVLVYRSEPLAEDVTLAGPLDADLWVSITGRDADFVVKLIDEYPGVLPGLDDEEKKTYPGGRQMLVRGEPMRGRFRNSYETPEPFQPGEVTHVAFRVNDLCHTFARGHRIMVQVQSSWFPFIDRNPQSWVPNIFEARDADFVKATHRVHRSAAHPSRLQVRVLPAPDANSAALSAGQ